MAELEDPTTRPGLPTAKPRWLDRIGTGLGLACAVHCMVTPVALGLLPAMGLAWVADERTETVLVALAVAIAAVAALWGWRLHRSPRMLAGFGLAAGLILLGHHLGELHASGRILSIAGALAIAGAHWWNARLRRHCAHARSF